MGNISAVGINITSIYYYRIYFPEYYVDIIGNHGDNLIAVLHDVDLHILNPSRNLIDKLYVLRCKKEYLKFNKRKQTQIHFIITDTKQAEQVGYQHVLLDIQKRNVLPQEIQLAGL